MERLRDSILFPAGPAQKLKSRPCNLFTVLLRFRFFVYQIEILLQNPVVLLAFYFFRAILKTGNEVLPRLFAETALLRKLMTSVMKTHRVIGFFCVGNPALIQDLPPAEF